jgi:hypothetical protein
LRRESGADRENSRDGDRNPSTMHILGVLQATVTAGACGGTIGGRSKETKVERVTAQAVFKAARLIFILIAPV